MTIERSRPVWLPSQKDAVEQHLLRDLRAVALPEPVREFRFVPRCCEHPKAKHHADTRSVHRPFCGICDRDFELGRDLFGVERFHSFDAGRMWRFDLAWPASMLAVEVDGGTFSGGRHTRGQGYEDDAIKLNEAVLRGWRVLRVTTAMVERGDALEFVERAFGRTGQP